MKTALVLIISIAIGCSESKSEQADEGLPLEVTATPILEGGKAVVRLDMVSVPDTFLYVWDADTMGKPAGKEADAQGRAAIVVDPQVAEGKTGTIAVRVRRMKSTDFVEKRIEVTMTLPIELDPEDPDPSRRGRIIGCTGPEHCSIILNGKEIDIRVPKDLKVTIDGRPIELKKNERTVVKLDPATLVARFGPADACNSKPSTPVAPAIIPVTLGLPDGRTLSSKLDLTSEMCSFAGFVLAAVAKGPVEPDASEGTVTAYPGSGGLQTTKPARYVRDIKRIVLADTTERTSSCGMYQDEVTKDRVEVLRYANDIRAKAYDRKTGKVIAERTFRAKFGKCERRIAKSAANNETTADWDLVDAWAKTL